MGRIVFGSNGGLGRTVRNILIAQISAQSFDCDYGLDILERPDFRHCRMA